MIARQNRKRVGSVAISDVSLAVLAVDADTDALDRRAAGGCHGAAYVHAQGHLHVDYEVGSAESGHPAMHFPDNESAVGVATLDVVATVVEEGDHVVAGQSRE